MKALGWKQVIFTVRPSKCRVTTALLFMLVQQNPFCITPIYKAWKSKWSRTRCLRVLWDELWLLKPMAFLRSCGFFKQYLISWSLPLEAKQNCVIFCKCFLMYHFLLKSFHKCDRTNLIYVIIHVAKTFKHCIVKCVVNNSRKRRRKL